MEKVIYKSEVYQIVGICMEVYNTPGYGFAEVVYKDAMELEFLEKEINCLREDEQQINYKGQLLKHSFFSDFTINQNIIIEVKSSKDGITDEHLAQTLNYLKASGVKLGLIVNFGKTSLEYKRLIY
ncbi:MAG: GxxExxY protein [Chitinophagaceae bacterium]|nr:GxxExxY protein [Chitinophagaceae bacterium]